MKYCTRVRMNPIITDAEKAGLLGMVVHRPGGLSPDLTRVRWEDGTVSNHYTHRLVEDSATAPEYTGGSSSYYTVDVKNTTSGGEEYTAECNDIIEALDMNFAEGNAFKAIWRRAAHRTLGKTKKGADSSGLYDAEKVEFFGARLVAQSKAVQGVE